MWQSLLRDSSFFELLDSLDHDLAEQAATGAAPAAAGSIRPTTPASPAAGRPSGHGDLAGPFPLCQESLPARHLALPTLGLLASPVTRPALLFRVDRPRPLPDQPQPGQR